MRRQPNYVFFTDPGHGWLRVPKDKLVALGIAETISRYSYAEGPYAYLEEDCDAPKFVRAMEAAGEEFGTAEVYQKVTPIRNYNRYSA